MNKTEQESAEIKNLKAKVKLLEDIKQDQNQVDYHIKSEAENVARLSLGKITETENGEIVMPKEVYNNLAHYIDCIQTGKVHLISKELSYVKNYIDRIAVKNEILALL